MTDTFSLMQGERIVLQGEPHPISLALWLPLCLGEAALLSMAGIPAKYHFYALALYALELAPFMARMLCTKLVLTNRRLYGKTGLLNTKSLEAPLNKLNAISVSYGLLGRIFGYGDVRVGTSSAAFVFPCIRTPEHFRHCVMEEIQRFEDEAKQPQP